MKVSLQSRIEKASASLSPNSQWKLVIQAALMDLGIDDTEAGLSVLEGDFVSFEDFQKELLRTAEEAGITPPPVPRLKLAWSLLKEEKKKEDSLSELVKTIKPVAQWSFQELLEQYSKDGTLAVHEELSKRTHGRHVIVFNEDESINMEASLNLIKKAYSQETPQVYKLSSGDLREVYRVGEFPMQVFHECPIHKDVILLDGYCEDCCDHWNTEDTERNAFLRLVVDKEPSVDIHPYLSRDLSELQKRFPKVYLLFKSLKEEEALPRLKRKLSKPKSGDPFRVVGTHRSF